MGSRTEILALVILISAGNAYAQAVDVLATIKPAGSDYNEYFEPSPKVSGQFVAGAHLGGPDERYRADTLGLLAPVDAPGTSVCVRIVSRDARYRAVNAYTIGGPEPVLPKLEQRRRQPDRLANYAAIDIAVRISAVSPCTDDAAGPLIPAVFGRAAPKVLRLMLNSGVSRVSAGLRQGDAVFVASRLCEPVASGSTTAFNMICMLELPKGLVPGRYTADITSIGMTGSRMSRPLDILLRDPQP